MNISKEAKELLHIIEHHDYEAYFVGGCVRDALLHRSLKDIDIATSATPEEIIDIFPHVIPVGIDHGTVLVRYKNVSYEVTTFRQESTYSDYRHPDDVQFIKDIKEDLARRDFTINAMALDRFGEILDPFGGREDLQAHIIRTVGQPEERFQEDALRIIRALRFSSQLGFIIEKQTLDQMNALKQQMEAVSVERITVECSKFFQGDYVASGLAYLQKTRMDAHLPIFKDHPQLLQRMPKISTAFSSFAEVIAMFSYLEPSISIMEWVTAWKCSNREKQEAQQLANAITYYEQNGIDNWLLYRIDTAHIQGFIHLIQHLFPDVQMTENELVKRKQLVPIASKKDICMNGNDIAELFPTMQVGAWIGQLINRLEYKLVMGELENQKYNVKEWIQCHPPDKR